MKKREEKMDFTKVFLVLAIVSTVVACAWGVTRTVKAIQFNNGCEQHLKRAADANTVDSAKEELEIAISYADDHNLTEGIVSIILQQPKNDIGFWYQNITDSYEELDKLTEDTTSLEKTNVLMKLRETLTDESEDGTEVTVPNGISIYPNNVVYFWWGAISLIACFVFWNIWFFCPAVNSYKYRK